MAWWRRNTVRKQELQTRSVSIADPVLAAMLGYSSPDGVIVSAHTAMTLSAWYRGVALIAGSIASLPLNTVESGPGGTSIPAGSWLDNPGGERMTPHELKEQCIIYLLNHGNLYLQHIYNGAGALSSVWPVHPLCVTPEWDDDRPGGKVFHVNITRMNNGVAKSETFDADSSTMTQVMGLSLDGLRGLSPIAAARMGLSTTLAGERAANKQFTNGAMISGMVTPAGDDDLESGEAGKVKEDLEVKVLGPDNAGSIAVMNRKLTFSPWQMNAADAQFIESRTFQVIEISRWLGVPPHLLSETEKATSWGSGIAEQNQGLARYTLQGWTSRLEDAFSRLITNPRRSAQFDYSKFVEPDPVALTGMLNTMVNGGWMTPNEARARVNLPPIAGGDLLRIPPGAAAPVALPSGGPTGIVPEVGAAA